VRIDHVAVWVRDLDRARAFYVGRLGGTGGPYYENPVTGLRTCFVTFGDGARLELMARRAGSGGPAGASAGAPGFAHVALALGSRDAVDAAVLKLEAVGVTVLGRPRVTGDGYYEAVVADPEGNPFELVG
jgi:lactoylglutathione lyase